MSSSSTEGDTASLDRLFAERYAGAEAAPARADTGLIEAMMARRSVRAYSDDPVSETDVKCAIGAAQSGASSSNLQVWSVVSVTETERKARLARLAGDQAHIKEAPLLLVWLADLSRLRRVTAMEESAADGLDYFEMYLTAAVDASLAAQNATVAFESMGYGTCYIGSMRSYPPEVAEELGLPAEVFPVFGMTVGRADPKRPGAIKPRLPQGSVFFEERYESGELDRSAKDYDTVLRRFQSGQGMPLLGWTRKSSERVASPASLKNRDKLRGYLRQLGFGLK